MIYLLYVCFNSLYRASRTLYRSRNTRTCHSPNLAILLGSLVFIVGKLWLKPVDGYFLSQNFDLDCLPIEFVESHVYIMVGGNKEKGKGPSKGKCLRKNTGLASVPVVLGLEAGNSSSSMMIKCYEFIWWHVPSCLTF